MATSTATVFIVDDDTEIREALQDLLDDEGYVSAAARDGQSALDYLRANPAPSLILLDWNMSPMNGSQFIAEIARNPLLSEIPIVLLTADVEIGTILRELPNAVVGKMRKPVDINALFEFVGRYCN